MAVVDWVPAWNSDLGSAKPRQRPAVTEWVYVKDGHLYLGREPFPQFQTNVLEALCGADDADERTGMPLRLAANGHTSARLVGFENKFYDGTNSQGVFYGIPWQEGVSVQSGQRCTNAGNLYSRTTGSTTGSTPPTHTAGSVSDGGVTWAYVGAAPANLYDETFLSRMDQVINNLNARGVYVWLTFANLKSMRLVAGLPNNTTSDVGMMWSDEWMTAYRAFLDDLLTRVNTVTNIRWCDNPGIMVWAPFNENGMAHAFFGSYLDAIVNQTGFSGYWKTELDAKLTTWWTANVGGLVPAWGPSSTRAFPTRAAWDAWGDLPERYALINFIAETETNCATALKAFLRGYNPNILFCYNTSNYCDMRANAVSDVTEMHVYSGPLGAAVHSTAYAARTSILKSDNNGFPMSYAYAMRFTTIPHLITERGDYGLNNWDWEVPLMEAIFHCMQDLDGFALFSEGQTRWQNLITGIQSTHLNPCWPTRRIAARLASMIIRHKLIGKLPNSLTYTIDPADVPAKIVTDNEAAWAINGYRYNSTNGGEWAWLSKRIYHANGSPTVTTSDTSRNDAAVTAGFTITLEGGDTVYIEGNATSAPKLDVNGRGVCGWMATLPTAGTLGPMTIDRGAAAAEPCLCLLVSDGSHDLMSGDMLLAVTKRSGFVGGDPLHNWTGVDGDTHTPVESPPGTYNWGTEADTRINTPAAFDIDLTAPCDMYVMPVNQDGTFGAALVTTYAAGVCSFTTDVNYPLYKLSPKAPPHSKARS